MWRLEHSFVDGPKPRGAPALLSSPPLSLRWPSDAPWTLGTGSKKGSTVYSLIKGRKPDLPLNHGCGRRGTGISPRGQVLLWFTRPPLFLPPLPCPQITSRSPLHLLFPRTDCLSGQAAKKPTPVSGLCQRLITLGNLTKLDCWGGAAREGVV